MNRLRALRKKAGITQAQLAKKAGTSQQQIQRIEAGQSIVLELAMSISNALGSPIDKVFPGAKSFAKRLKPSPSPTEFWDAAKMSEKDLNAADIDAEVVPWWHVILTLTNGVKRAYSLNKVELDRVWHAIQNARPNDETTEFIAFDTEDRQVVANVEHVAHVHVGWDLDLDAEDAELPKAAADHFATVFLAHQQKPLLILAEPDERQADVLQEDEEENGADNDQPIDTLIYILCSCASRQEFHCLHDRESGSHLIKAGEIALFEAPYRLLGYDSEDDDNTVEEVLGVKKAVTDDGGQPNANPNGKQ